MKQEDFLPKIKATKELWKDIFFPYDPDEYSLEERDGELYSCRWDSEYGIPQCDKIIRRYK